ncbi:MAG: SRPBCC domain-containing protein [Pararhodobacter sp.]
MAAPPEHVWALLTDPEAHSGWNPMFQTVEGSFTPGNRIRLTMLPPYGGSMAFRGFLMANTTSG